jgi:hypothetical protein
MLKLHNVVRHVGCRIIRRDKTIGAIFVIEEIIDLIERLMRVPLGALLCRVAPSSGDEKED